jgi:hypothetical protein
MNAMTANEMLNLDNTTEPLLAQGPSELSLEQLDDVQGGLVWFLAGVGVGILVAKLL